MCGTRHIHASWQFTPLESSFTSLRWMHIKVTLNMKRDWCKRRQEFLSWFMLFPCSKGLSGLRKSWNIVFFERCCEGRLSGGINLLALCCYAVQIWPAETRRMNYQRLLSGKQIKGLWYMSENTQRTKTPNSMRHTKSSWDIKTDTNTWAHLGWLTISLARIQEVSSCPLTPPPLLPVFFLLCFCCFPSTLSSG